MLNWNSITLILFITKPLISQTQKIANHLYTKKIHKLIKAKKEKKGEILIWDLDGGGNEARMASFSLSLSLSLSNGFEEGGEEISWFDDKYGG